MRELKEYLKGLYILFRNLSLFHATKSESESEKRLYINLKRNPFSRHLYNLLLIYEQRGYTIYVVPSPNFLYDCYSDTYAKRILTHLNIKFSLRFRLGNFNIEQKNYSINSKLSAEYFNTKKEDLSSYNAPIGTHPNISEEIEHDTEKVDGSSRLNKVFFSGNLDRTVYDNFELKRIFGICNRNELVNSVSELTEVEFPLNKEMYMKNRNQTTSKVIIHATENFFFYRTEYLKELRKYNFFLACPGYLKPTCHNLVEAMKCGTVPIIQKNYAAILNPPLEDGVNAIVFDQIRDISKVIDKALDLQAQDIRKLRDNVYLYFNKFLSKSAVYIALQDERIKTIFLESGEESVRMYFQEET